MNAHLKTKQSLTKGLLYSLQQKVLYINEVFSAQITHYCNLEYIYWETGTVAQSNTVKCSAQQPRNQAGIKDDCDIYIC